MWQIIQALESLDICRRFKRLPYFPGAEKPPWLSLRTFRKPRSNGL